MKLFLSFLIVLLFIGCTTPTPKLQTTPKWYSSRTIDTKAKYEIIGYGEGKSSQEAKANAKVDIAETLNSQVTSSIAITTSVDNDDAQTQRRSNLKVTSNLNLQNVKVIKQEEQEGRFFVALQYNNLDLAYRMKTRVGKFHCDDAKRDSYLDQTPLIQRVTASLGCKLDLQLERKNSAWYLQYKEHLFALTPKEFEELFVTTKNRSFGFKPSRDILVDGDSFYFTFHSKERGYITLLDVYANGIVTLIQPSVAIKGSLQIPSQKSKNYFEAGVLQKGKDTYDLYVAIFSKKPLDMSRFVYASEDLASSELAYKFDELMRVLNGYRYSTVLLRTRANKSSK